MLDSVELRNKEVKQSERRLTLALEASNDGLWDWSIPSGKVIYSDRWFTMLGHQLDRYPQDIETFKKTAPKLTGLMWLNFCKAS